MSDGSEEGQTLAALRAEMFRELEVSTSPCADGLLPRPEQLSRHRRSLFMAQQLTDEQGAQLRSLLGTDPCRAEREALSAAEKGLQELGSRKAEGRLDVTSERVRD